MSYAKYADVDASAHPMVYVRFTGENSTDENFSSYLQSVKACYDKGERIAIIFDASQAALPGYNHIKMQASWLKDNEQLMKDLCAGTAYIIPNGMVRGVLKMIFTLQKQPVPYTTVANYGQAVEWLKSIDASLIVPKALKS